MQRGVGRTIITREQIATRVREMGLELTEDLASDLARHEHGDEEGSVVLVPILTGAMIFVADLVRHMSLKMRFDLIAVSSYPGKSTQSKGARLKSQIPDGLSGKHVVIVDDILDSGETIAMVRSVIAEQNPASLRVCVLLEKKTEHQPTSKADYVGFPIPDEFVVGYGLDYDGHYRNHPEIVTLTEEVL